MDALQSRSLLRSFLGPLLPDRSWSDTWFTLWLGHANYLRDNDSPWAFSDKRAVGGMRTVDWLSRTERSVSGNRGWVTSAECHWRQ